MGMRKTTEELWKQALAEQTVDSDVPETFRRLCIENERECAETVGVTASLPGTNNGYTFVAFNGSDVPVGTKLFTFPPAAQVSEWQPIETAPKELGKRILGLKDCGEGTLTSISIVFWLNDGEWYLYDHASGTAEGFGYRVTHWMPLPAAPEVKP